MTEQTDDQELAPVEGAVVEGQDSAVDTASTAQEADPFEPFARERGWSPKEEWRGRPEDWRDPKDFISIGMERGRAANHELRELKGTVDRIGKTAEKLAARQIEETRRELEQRFAGAVEKQDQEGARVAREELARLETPAQNGPPPEVNDFMTRNAAWYGSNRAATALAQSITGQLAAQGASPADQLRQAEEAVRADFPQLFGQHQREPAKPAPSVNAPNTRAAAVTKPAGFASLPAEAQRAGHDFVKRGMVKTLEDYARVYREENA